MTDPYTIMFLRRAARSEEYKRMSSVDRVAFFKQGYQAVVDELDARIEKRFSKETDNESQS